MSKKLKIAAGVLGASAALYSLVGEGFFGVFLTKKGVELSNKLLPPVDQTAHKIFTENPVALAGYDCYKSAQKNEVHTYTREGKACHGYLVKTSNPSDKYVICCHGYSSNPQAVGNIGLEFQKRGFNVLFPVLNGHADSETGLISMGWYDRLIVVAFAEWITDMNPNAQIVLHGVSMGGATVMMATGERMPENVKCCVEDCGYTSAWDVFSVQVKDYANLSVFPFIYAADTFTRLHAKYSFKECSALNQVRKSITPTLFIHGERDTFVPFWMLETNFKAAVCEKQKLAVPDAVHAVSSIINPELYWGKVDEFLTEYVK